MVSVGGDRSVRQELGVEAIKLPFLPDHQVHIGLFRDVQNAHFLRQQLLSGNAEFEYAFIDAPSIVSTRHVLAACFRAMNDSINNRLRSRNVHSEIVYALNANSNVGLQAFHSVSREAHGKQITDSFRHFGVSDATTSLIAVKVTPSSSALPPTTSVSEHLRQNIQGTLLPFTDEAVASLTDFARVKKLYKLNTSDSGGRPGKNKPPKRNGVNGAEHGAEGRIAGVSDDRVEVEAVILGIMAMKGS